MHRYGGGDLYGREGEIERLWEQLAHGHVLLTAPRRHGKTSVMYGLVDQPPTNWEVIFADIEYIDNPADLLDAVLAELLTNRPVRRAIERIKSIPAAIADWIRGALSQVEAGVESVGQIKLALREGRPDRGWQELGGLVVDLFQAFSEAQYLVVLDEFPIFVESLFRHSEADAVQFLRWFRATRLSLRNVHFLLGGSINLETSLARRGHSALVNDLDVFRLRPFHDRLARDFVDGLLAEHLDTGQKLGQPICEVVGQGVPFYLAMVTAQVLDAIRIEDYPAVAETVHRIYHDRVLGPDCRSRFDHYRSRLKEYLEPEDEQRARLILCRLAHGPQREEVLLAEVAAHGLETGPEPAGERVLSQLEADYYVIRQDGQVRFLHRILADWWRINIPAPARRG